MVRRKVVQLLLPMALACGGLLPNSGHAEEATDAAAVKSRFDYLSQHGNVQCSVQFENSDLHCCEPVAFTRRLAWRSCPKLGAA
jgi:hypothetical protein